MEVFCSFELFQRPAKASLPKNRLFIAFSIFLGEAMSEPLICPKCSYERKASDKAPSTECPACGIVFAKYKQYIENKEQQALEGGAALKGKKPTTILGHPPLLVVALCSLVFAAAWMYGVRTAKEEPRQATLPIYDSTSAQVACERFVVERLKAPATAAFQSFDKLSVSGSGTGPWRVSGYVDSQNSFGALLRSNYTCVVEFSGDNVKLISLSVN